MRLSVRFRFFDDLDGWSRVEDELGRLKVWALGVACSRVEVNSFVTRGRNALVTSVGRGAVSMSSSSSSEVSEERSDSSSTRSLARLRSGETGPASSLSTSSVESAIEDNGVKERDRSSIATCSGLMAG